jgi:hypothetical protein
VTASFDTLVVIFEATCHPLGQTPGENVCEGDHPDGRHTAVSTGPRFIQMLLVIFAAQRSVRHALGGVNVVVKGSGAVMVPALVVDAMLRVEQADRVR